MNADQLDSLTERVLGAVFEVTNTLGAGFLEKSGAQGVGDLKDGTQHALSQRIQLIGVHRRSSAAKLKCRSDANALENNSSAADKRRSTPILAGTAGLALASNSWTLH